MTFREAASAMRRLADGIDKIVDSHGRDVGTGTPTPMLEGDHAVGGAAILCYIRDLVTTSGRETYDRPTLLVILEAISRDAQIFPCGVGTVIWNAEDDDES